MRDWILILTIIALVVILESRNEPTRVPTVAMQPINPFTIVTNGNQVTFTYDKDKYESVAIQHEGVYVVRPGVLITLKQP